MERNHELTSGKQFDNSAVPMTVQSEKFRCLSQKVVSREASENAAAVAVASSDRRPETDLAIPVRVNRLRRSGVGRREM